MNRVNKQPVPAPNARQLPKEVRLWTVWEPRAPRSPRQVAGGLPPHHSGPLLQKQHRDKGYRQIPPTPPETEQYKDSSLASHLTCPGRGRP